jgi:hypothetical protein
MSKTCVSAELSDALALEFIFEGINPAEFLREVKITPTPTGQWALLSKWLTDHGWKVVDNGTSNDGKWWAAPLPNGHSKVLVPIEEAVRRQAFRIIAMHLREVGYNVRYEVRQGMVIGFGKCLIPGTYRKVKGRLLYRGSTITMTMAATREGFL